MGAPKRRNAPRWEASEDQVLQSYEGQGLSREEMARRAARLLAGRSPEAVMMRSRVLQLAFPTRQCDGKPRVVDQSKPRRKVQLSPRMCLMCLKMFGSEGPGHRICRVCKSGPDWERGNANPQMEAPTNVCG